MRYTLTVVWTNMKANGMAPAVPESRGGSWGWACIEINSAVVRELCPLNEPLMFLPPDGAALRLGAGMLFN